MDAQTVVALAIVALCAVYVTYRWLRVCLGKSDAGCHSGGCSGCPNNHGCTGEGHNDSRHSDDPSKLTV